MTNTAKTEKEKRKDKEKFRKKPISNENFSKLRETTLIPFLASSNASRNTELYAEMVENLIR